jgi:putative zinc finger protein
MGITCEEVWRDISDYVDNELDQKQRAVLEEHFAQCRHCAAVLEGTCNVIRLYRDERVLAPPKGFHDRLHARLNQRLNQGPDGKNRPLASCRSCLDLGGSCGSAVGLRFILSETIYSALARTPEPDGLS